MRFNTKILRNISAKQSTRFSRRTRNSPKIAGEKAIKKPSPHFKGEVRVFHAFMIGDYVEFSKAKRLNPNLQTLDTGEKVLVPQRGPSNFGLEPSPLWCPTGQRTFDFTDVRADSQVTVYDFGSLSLETRFPFQGSLPEWIQFSKLLNDHRHAVMAESEKQMRSFFEQFRRSIDKPTFVPDYDVYFVFGLDVPKGLRWPSWFKGERNHLAKLLNRTTSSLSAEEINRILNGKTCYGEQNGVIVDWESSLIVDDNRQDICRVLEYANVKLLELEQIDQRTDALMNGAYRHFRRGFFSYLQVSVPFWSDSRRLFKEVADATLCLDGVNNAIKLTDDRLLAQVLKLCRASFRFDDLDGQIQRKLDYLTKISSEGVIRAEARLIIWLFIADILVSLWLHYH